MAAKSKAWRKRVVKAIPSRQLALWRGAEQARAILTVTGELWLSTRDRRWKQKPGAWTTDRVDRWAAAAGYLRTGNGIAAYTSVRRTLKGNHGDGPTVGFAGDFPEDACAVRRVRRTKSAADGFGPRAAAGPVVPGYAVVEGDRVRELGPVPAAGDVFTAAEQAARIEYYAARAAAKLPLDGVPAAVFRRAG